MTKALCDLFLYYIIVGASININSNDQLAIISNYKNWFHFPNLTFGNIPPLKLNVVKCSLIMDFLKSCQCWFTPCINFVTSFSIFFALFFVVFTIFRTVVTTFSTEYIFFQCIFIVIFVNFGFLSVHLLPRFQSNITFYNHKVTF